MAETVILVPTVSDPVNPTDRRAQLVGAFTAGLGVLFLLVVLVTLLWALGRGGTRPSYSDHFGFSGLAGMIVWGVLGVCGIVVLPLGFHYYDTGQRVRRTGIADLRLTAAISSILAVSLGAVPLKNLLSIETVLAACAAALFGLHALLLFYVDRPVSPPASTTGALADRPRPFN